MYRQKSKNLLKLGCDFTNPNTEEEYFKIQSLLTTEYHILCESQLSIMKKYQIPSSRTMDILFRVFDITSRSLSDARYTSDMMGRQPFEFTPGGIFKNCKRGWHKTWDGKLVYLRSSYEFNYAEILDSQKIKYDCENLRIKYFDTQENRYRVAVPDFYLFESKTIVEIKSSYTLDTINMDDRIKSFLEAGFNFKLILDGQEQLEWRTRWVTIP